MPRVMIIRHGESQDNHVGMGLGIQLRKGRITREQWKLEHGRRLSQDGDAPLSELGRDQARKLAEYYTPILSEAARSGHIHFYVSPFLRNLETAEPLVSSLGLSAECRADLGEVPGLLPLEQLHPAQLLAEAGDAEGAQANLRATAWRPAGLSGTEISARFPWARLQPGAFPDAGPWYREGYEFPEKAKARVGRIHAWLLERAGALGEDDIIAFVCHGHTIALLLQEIISLGSPDVYFENVDNSSVTMLIMGQVRNGPGPKRAFSFFPQATDACKVQLEFFNRCDHLGERMHNYFQYVDIMPRQKYKERLAKMPQASKL